MHISRDNFDIAEITRSWCKENWCAEHSAHRLRAIAENCSRRAQETLRRPSESTNNVVQPSLRHGDSKASTAEPRNGAGLDRYLYPLA